MADIKWRVVRYLVAFLMLVGSVYAQQRDQLAVYAGAVVSNNPEYGSQVLLEVPFSVNRNQFSFFVQDSTDSNLYARVFAQLDLIDSTGFAVDSARTYFSLRVADAQEAAINDYRIFNRLALMARPGRYAARITVIDVASKAQGEFFIEKITIESSQAEKLTIGGARLAYDLKYVGDDETQQRASLYKNGFILTPNPVSVFANDDTAMFVYGEIYGLQTGGSVAQKYRMSLTVLDRAGQVYQSLGSRVADKPGSSAVIAESIDIAGWHVGQYRVEIAAEDLGNGACDTAYLPFSIVSPEAVLLAAATATNFEKGSYVDTLPLQDQVNMVKYLLVPEEMALLQSLTDEGKKNYLAQYWEEHDDVPATSEIEKRAIMADRYFFANKIYSTNAAKTNGWLTDRGRIYMTYGDPDERDQHPAPRVGNAFEVWYYRSLDEGKYFVFEDEFGNDEYRIVHSNVFGERYDKSWQDLIDQGHVDVENLD